MSEKVMGKGRLEAFSDGVIAILITIMVLELKTPHGDTLAALLPSIPAFLSYILSFIYIGIYWNNHHHMLMAAQRVNGGILWANMHLLFWLSLIPFATAWMGENHFTALPTAVYGLVLFFCAISYFILQYAIMCEHGVESALSRAIGRDSKGKLSLVFYLAAIMVSMLAPHAAQILYCVVAGMWLIPDRRIEKTLKSS